MVFLTPLYNRIFIIQGTTI